MEPGCRLGVTDIVVQERPILQCEHFLHCRYFGNWDDRFAFAVQTETPDLRGTAEQVANVQRVGGRHDLLDHRFARRNDLNGFG